MSILVRSRGGHRRGGRWTLARSRPVPVRRIPPVPYQGQVYRPLYPTAVADYESKATASWTAANLKTRISSYSPVTFAGDEMACYVYALSVPEESTDDVEAVLDPLRYSIDMTASESGTCDYLLEGNPPSNIQLPFDAGGPTALHAFVSQTLLPSSGSSHVSDGKPTWLQLPNAFCPVAFEQAWYDYGGWLPTNYTTPTPHPFNFEVVPRWARLRLNGAAVGNLLDFEDFFNDRADYRGGRLAQYYNQVLVSFPSFPGQTGYGLRADFEFDFTAGDTFDIDVWWWVRHKAIPASGSGAKTVLACTARHRVSDGLRPYCEGEDHTTGLFPVSGQAAPQNGRPGIWLAGLKMSDGFDPDADTYNITFSLCDWEPGDGTSGPHKMKTADGWTAFIQSDRIRWNGPIQDGGLLDGQAAWFDFVWSTEIPTLRIYIGTSVQYYRPQNSSDYVAVVTDRHEGAITNAPCGVFNHLGTTTFAKYYGTRPSPSFIPADTTFPETITVAKTAQ
jgi:hypothetical protein